MNKDTRAAFAQMIAGTIGIVFGLIWVTSAGGWNQWLAAFSLGLSAWCWGRGIYLVVRTPRAEGKPMRATAIVIIGLATMVASFFWGALAPGFGWFYWLSWVVWLAASGFVLTFFRRAVQEIEAWKKARR